MRLIILNSKWSKWRKRLQHLGIKNNWAKSSSKRDRLKHILKNFKGKVSFPVATEVLKMSIIAPVINAWPERSASAVKRIKSRQWSTMKNNLLNELLHIPMHWTPANSPEPEQLISRVVEKYCKQKHNEVPQIYVQRKIDKMTCTKTEKNNIDKNNKDIVKIVEQNARTGRWIFHYKFWSSSDDACGSSDEDDDNGDADDEI